jgi:hypothetical protein
MKSRKKTDDGADAAARREASALAMIAGASDPDRLRAMMANAERLDVPSVRDAAFRRLAVVQSEGEPGTAEHDLWSAIHATEEMKRREAGRRSLLGPLRRDIQKLGLVPAIDKLVSKPGPSERFEELIGRGYPELTAEAVVVAHPARFGAEARERSEERLRGAGVDPTAPAA